MSTTGRQRRRARNPPTERALWPLTLAVAASTAAAVVLAHAFWVCVPGALLVSCRSHSRMGAAVSSAAVLGAACAAVTVPHPRTEPSLSGLVVTAASVAILLRHRERIERERDLARASACADPLTGAANRRAMLERIAYEIARHTRTGRSFGVLILDLDGFKLLNDRFGHLAGDDLLRDVAVAIGRAVRDQDTVARMGGDEFCVLAPETSASGVRTLADRATEAVSRAAVGIESLGASAGTALFPADGRDAEALLHAADQRLLAAKRARVAERRAA